MRYLEVKLGYSVSNQLDTSRYFSISRIDKKCMAKYGINLTITNFKELAKRSPPYTKIMTGNATVPGQQKMINIYRYEDFIKKGGADT